MVAGPALNCVNAHDTRRGANPTRSPCPLRVVAPGLVCGAGAEHASPLLQRGPQHRCHHRTCQKCKCHTSNPTQGPHTHHVHRHRPHRHHIRVRVNIHHHTPPPRTTPNCHTRRKHTAKRPINRRAGLSPNAGIPGGQGGYMSSTWGASSL